MSTGSIVQFCLNINRIFWWTKITFHIRLLIILVRFETWATTIPAPTTSRCQNESFVRKRGQKMAEVMATISRSLHGNGLETCQPSPSVYDFTCCNGTIEKHIHAYTPHSAAHLRFACYSFSSLIADTSEQELSNYSVIYNQKKLHFDSNYI